MHLLSFIAKKREKLHSLDIFVEGQVEMIFRQF